MNSYQKSFILENNYCLLKYIKRVNIINIKEGSLYMKRYYERYPAGDIELEISI